MLAPARANDQNFHRASMITNAGKRDADGKLSPTLWCDVFGLPAFLRQSKANNIWTDGNRNKLLPADHEGHGRRLVFPVGRKMPQGLSVAFIEGDKVSTRVAIE